MFLVKDRLCIPQVSYLFLDLCGGWYHGKTIYMRATWFLPWTQCPFKDSYQVQVVQCSTALFCNLYITSPKRRTHFCLLEFQVSDLVNVLRVRIITTHHFKPKMLTLPDKEISHMAFTIIIATYIFIQDNSITITDLKHRQVQQISSLLLEAIHCVLTCAVHHISLDRPENSHTRLISAPISLQMRTTSVHFWPQSFFF